MEKMIVMKAILLWTKTLMLMKQHLQMPNMYSYQRNNLQSMKGPNLVCWIVSKDYGKGSAMCAQFPMVTMKNCLLRK